MIIVVDASLIASLFLPLPYSDLSARKITSWKREGASIYAPTLLLYELSTVFRKAIIAGYIGYDQVPDLLDQLLQLGFETIPPSRTNQEAALRYVEVLGQSKAYGAQYLAVAKQLQAQLWTADRRLANAARGADLDWVQWIGDDQASQQPSLAE